MPGRSPQCCRVFGCSNVEPCSLHGRSARAIAWDAARGSKKDRGYGARWERFRRAWLLEMQKRRFEVERFGLCGARLPGARPSTDSVCAQEGRIVVGVVADHIVPVTGPNDPTFYRLESLQLLCRTCDQAKRQRESIAARSTG